MIHDVIINGIGGCGKDTFIKEFKKICGDEINVYSFSSIDPFRGIVQRWGSIKKDENHRKALSLIKEAATLINDYPLRHLLDCRCGVNAAHRDAVIFYHIREPEEIEKLVGELEELHSDPVTLLIYRYNIETPNNKSDQSVFNFDYGVEIGNNGTTEDLRDKARVFAKYLEERDEYDGL